jgi:TolB-like protein/Flp pilus assembly protein TadD
VYAAASFVILELISIIEEPFGLPDWTLRFVFVILCIGLIILIILSWIYDITPEGLEKTKPVKEVKNAVVEKPSTVNAWRIATFISVVVIIVLIIFNIFGRRGKVEDLVMLDKSIAVRPFWNESTEKENEFFVNGMTEDIRNLLSKIADLRVHSRGSVEKYRDPKYSTTDIARDLNVTYILEGTAQRIVNQVKIHVQLILAETDDHLWDTSYIEDIKDVKQVFDIQNQIAQSVAKEIKAIITPEEQQLIEKIPTASLTAYDFYQRGRVEYYKLSRGQDNYLYSPADRNILERAENLYYNSLEYDSTFALAYTGLARIYWDQYFWETFLEEGFLDSVLILADMALSFDDQLSEAFVVKGDYYREKNIIEKSIIEYDRAIQFNPNDWMAYAGKGQSYYSKGDYIKAIENIHKAISLHRGTFLPDIYRDLANLLVATGFKERGYYFAKEALKLDNDSAEYYDILASSESDNGSFKKSIEFSKRAIAIDSMNPERYALIGKNHSFLGQFEEAIVYYQKAKDRGQVLNIPESVLSAGMLRLGQAYMINGLEDEATYYLNRARELFFKRLDELDRVFFDEIVTIHALTGMYACLGEKDKAFERLRLYNQKQHFPVWIVVQLKVDPLFNSIRDEPEFQQILRDVEAKYQIQHEEIRKWLEENVVA